MSKRKQTSSRFSQTSRTADESFEKVNCGAVNNQTHKFSFRKKIFISGIIVFFGLSVFGAGLKYLEDDARMQLENTKGQFENIKTRSLLNRYNPFLPAPPPAPTPQLSKEYIYAGSRLLAVEDANANAAPPADLAVWRPSTGVWWVMGGAGSQQVSVQWGLSSDKAVPGDYDGDGKTDFSVFRPTEGNWYIQRSSDNVLLTYNFGISGDKMAQADYDGDGRTDAAIFRPSNGVWYILKSSDGGIIYQQFGLSSDTPSSADYDGDGKADIGVWRSTNSTFYSLNSSNQALQTPAFSQPSTEPVSADYDGDGKADYAIRSSNNWIIRYSSTGVIQPAIAWQSSGDAAVHNDYDGDGKVDIAVWKSDGNWYIKNSSNGQTRNTQWGTAGDIPVPAFYRR